LNQIALTFSRSHILAALPCPSASLFPLQRFNASTLYGATTLEKLDFCSVKTTLTAMDGWFNIRTAARILIIRPITITMPKLPTLIVVALVLALLFLVAGFVPLLPQLMPHSLFDWLVMITLAVFFVGVGGADIWQIRRITKYIRDKHPDALKRLGVINVRLAGFARHTRNSLGLHDPVLDQMFNFKRRFDKVTALLFIMIFAAIYLLHRAMR
jgi:hypothetical protein